MSSTMFQQAGRWGGGTRRVGSADRAGSSKTRRQRRETTRTRPSPHRPSRSATSAAMAESGLLVRVTKLGQLARAYQSVMAARRDVAEATRRARSTHLQRVVHFLGGGGSQDGRSDARALTSGSAAESFGRVASRSLSGDAIK